MKDINNEDVRIDQQQPQMSNLMQKFDEEKI